MDERYYRVYDEGSDKVWFRRFISEHDARAHIANAYRIDALGQPVWGVIGPLHVISLGDPFPPPDDWRPVALPVRGTIR